MHLKKNVILLFLDISFGNELKIWRNCDFFKTKTIIVSYNFKTRRNLKLKLLFSEVSFSSLSFSLKLTLIICALCVRLYTSQNFIRYNPWLCCQQFPRIKTLMMSEKKKIKFAGFCKSKLSQNDRFLTFGQKQCLYLTVHLCNDVNNWQKK